MKFTIFSSLAGAGLLLFSLAAGTGLAQQYQDDQGWHHTRQEFYAGGSWRMHLFDRVRADLDHIQTMAFGGGDQYRIVHTKQEVTELQGKLAAGAYDQPELDDVIGGLQKILADNRIGPTDREMLTDDLSRLREYRDHHDNWR